MTEEQKKIKRYVNALELRLKLPLKLKVRINEDIGTEIHLRMEAGESVDEILEEMGSPESVAERLYLELYLPSRTRLNHRFLLSEVLPVQHLLTVAPGVILNLVVLVMAWIRMRKKRGDDIR